MWCRYECFVMCLGERVGRKSEESILLHTKLCFVVIRRLCKLLKLKLGFAMYLPACWRL